MGHRLGEFAPTLDFFESTVGPYPWGDEKLGVVETPHLGMEHQTINAYGNKYAKAPEGFDWLFQALLALLLLVPYWVPLRSSMPSSWPQR